MKKKNIYCVYCGEKNNIKDKKCKKCKKKLDPKENRLLDYIKGKIIGEIKENFQDKNFSFLDYLVFNPINKFLNKFLTIYASMIPAALIVVVLSALIVNNDKTVITEVNDKPNILINNLNKCVINNSIEPIKVCDEGYTLSGNICMNFEEVSATRNDDYNVEYSCSEGVLFDDKCLIMIEKEALPGCLDGYILNEECNLCVLGE